MATKPEAIIDTLNGLLEAKVNSIFRCVRDGSPYISGADANIRALLDDLDVACHSERRALVAMIESLGGTPRVRKQVIDEQQYLSYLSLKFLLPKLVSEGELLITRFENGRMTIGGDFPQVSELLESIESVQRGFLDRLKKAACQVTGGKFTAPAHGSTEPHPAE